MKGNTKKDPFPSDKFSYMVESQPYFDSLSKLAHKWKLRAPWAVGILFLLDLMEVSGDQEFLGKIDIPLEKLSLIYPWAPPLPPLEISVPAWAFFTDGRQAILEEIDKKLEKYESELKAEGLYEHPSALDKHARRWFQYYVHGRPYDEIVQDEVYTPGGALISYAKNVGAAVRKFSKLIQIDPKALK